MSQHVHSYLTNLRSAQGDNEQIQCLERVCLRLQADSSGFTPDRLKTICEHFDTIVDRLVPSQRTFQLQVLTKTLKPHQDTFCCTKLAEYYQRSLAKSSVQEPTLEPPPEEDLVCLHGLTKTRSRASCYLTELEVDVASLNLSKQATYRQKIARILQSILSVSLDCSGSDDQPIERLQTLPEHGLAAVEPLAHKVACIIGRNLAAPEQTAAKLDTIEKHIVDFTNIEPTTSFTENLKIQIDTFRNRFAEQFADLYSAKATP